MKKSKMAINFILFYLFSIYSLYGWIRFEKVNVITIILSIAALFYFINNLDDGSYGSEELV